MNLITLSTRLLRDPVALIAEFSDPANPDGLRRLMPALLALVGLGGGIFGAVVGSYRGGLQTVYAAAKFPFLLLIPVLVCLPAIHAICAACEVEVRYTRLALAGLAGLARTAILLAASSPIIWLVYSVHIDYHLAILAMVGTLGLVGLPGLSTVVRTLPGSGMLRQAALAGSLGLICLCMAQSGWLLRPFVARPAGEVSFLRPVEEDIFSSLGATVLASLGAYQDWEPEGAGVIGRTGGRGAHEGGE